MAADLQQQAALQLEIFFLDGTWITETSTHDERLRMPGYIKTAGVMYMFVQHMQDYARIHSLLNITP
jgi:hypothetical protein